MTNDETNMAIVVLPSRPDMVMEVSLLGSKAETVENQKLLFNGVLPSLTIMKDDFIVPYPSTRIALQDNIYIDVPTAYTDINPFENINNKTYFNARTLNSDGRFTSEQSALTIAAYGPQKRSGKPMEIAEEDKFEADRELLIHIGGSHINFNPYTSHRISGNYNWLIQDDATGYTRTERTFYKDGKEHIGMYYVGNVGNDQFGYYLLMINVEQPIDGVFDYEQFLAMIKSIRIEGKNPINRLDHSLVIPVKVQ